LSLGWEPQMLPSPYTNAGCPTLATFLSLSLGWEPRMLPSPYTNAPFAGKKLR